MDMKTFEVRITRVEKDGCFDCHMLRLLMNHVQNVIEVKELKLNTSAAFSHRVSALGVNSPL